jgi:hypothetical protein
MALTDIAIRGARLSARPYKVYDRDGLFLCVIPSINRKAMSRAKNGEDLI